MKPQAHFQPSPSVLAGGAALQPNGPAPPQTWFRASFAKPHLAQSHLPPGSGGSIMPPIMSCMAFIIIIMSKPRFAPLCGRGALHPMVPLPPQTSFCGRFIKEHAGQDHVPAPCGLAATLRATGRGVLQPMLPVPPQISFWGLFLKPHPQVHERPGALSPLGPMTPFDALPPRGVLQPILPLPPHMVFCSRFWKPQMVHGHAPPTRCFLKAGIAMLRRMTIPVRTHT
mmetsp:Transcript_113843/g.321975  ORF Transcript_113843/g.321975 Transcript_113843/m.321975 type:complete len:227 (+) Transcript_113843:451-1131(+)